jgi:L-asparaginase II
MRGFPGTVSKAGAEGLGCVALPGGGAVAVKALDGADRAVGPALIALLVRQLGFADVPDVAAHQSRPPVTNDVGAVVGELVPTLP